MVFIVYKKGEQNQFIISQPSSTPIEEVKAQIVEINNLRIKVDCLAVAVEGLAQHGVIRPEALRGLTSKDTIESALVNLTKEEREDWVNMKPGPDERYSPDENCYRTGIVKKESLCKMMLETCTKAKMVLKADRVKAKNLTTKEILEENVNNLRGAVMICYPAYYGLPVYEAARFILEDKDNFALQKHTEYDYYEAPEKASLWFANKELLDGKTLSDYIGKNEKTKIICKLTNKGTGAPVREPMIKQKEYVNMLSYYKKKESQWKKLDEDNDDQYLHQPWADTKAMKNQLHGNTKSVKYR